jgi:hypothetical protein
VGEKLLTKQAKRGLSGLETPDRAKYLAAIVTCYPDGGDLTGSFIDKEIAGTTHIGASIRQIYSPLRVSREARQKVLSYSDDLMGLTADAGHLSCEQNVLTFPICPPERVAGERSGGGLLPGHNHSAVESPSQRHSDRFTTIEIPREVLSEDFLEFPVVSILVQRGLVLPLLRLEVVSFLLDGAMPKDPSRSCGQNMHAIEDRSILQSAAAGDEFPQPPEVRPPQFGTNRQDRFSLRGEIEGFLRLVIVDSIHPIPVVEEGRRSAGSIYQQSVEPSVQTSRKGGVFLIEVDEVGGPFKVKHMAPLLETTSDSRLGEFLP